jgi:hypothetical protein
MRKFMNIIVEDNNSAEYTLVPTQTSYCVELPTEDYLAVEHNDEKGESLLDKLGAIPSSGRGVLNVEYNGHFGAYIFFTIDKEDDTPELHDAIIKTIRAHIA